MTRARGFLPVSFFHPRLVRVSRENVKCHDTGDGAPKASLFPPGQRSPKAEHDLRMLLGRAEGWPPPVPIASFRREVTERREISATQAEQSPSPRVRRGLGWGGGDQSSFRAARCNTTLRRKRYVNFYICLFIIICFYFLALQCQDPAIQKNPGRGFQLGLSGQPDPRVCSQHDMPWRRQGPGGREGLWEGNLGGRRWAGRAQGHTALWCAGVRAHDPPLSC